MQLFQLVRGQRLGLPFPIARQTRRVGHPAQCPLTSWRIVCGIRFDTAQPCGSVPARSQAHDRGTPARFAFSDWVKASLAFGITNVVPPCKRVKVPHSAARNYRQPKDATDDCVTGYTGAFPVFIRHRFVAQQSSVARTARPGSSRSHRPRGRSATCLRSRPAGFCARDCDRRSQPRVCRRWAALSRRQ